MTQKITITGPRLSETFAENREKWLKDEQRKAAKAAKMGANELQEKPSVQASHLSDNLLSSRPQVRPYGQSFQRLRRERKIL